MSIRKCSRAIAGKQHVSIDPHFGLLSIELHVVCDLNPGYLEHLGLELPPPHTHTPFFVFSRHGFPV
jgi:hypothetical protein